MEKAAEDYGPFSKEMDEKLRQVGRRVVGTTVRHDKLNNFQS